MDHELPVLFAVRLKGVLVFLCEIDCGKRRISLPQSWTGRGSQAQPNRLAVDGLTAAREFVDALAARLRAATGDEQQSNLL
ncbi:hypothetical protein [Micromonospora sp. DT62]|uniref:hypothetical protein n=1 Tax=Micromonospora sp. DT62 TaxID=3416521 RepID=UPI003CEF29F2